MMSSRFRDVGGLEASAEVAGRGRIGNAVGAESVEEDLVVATQFDVLQAIAVAKGVVGEVEDVIRFVIRQMDLEQVQPLVDGVDEANAFGEKVKGADAAVSDGAVALADLVMDVAGGEDGSVRGDRRPLAARPFFEPPLNSPLASFQLSSYLGIHSKLLFRSCDQVWLLHQTTQKSLEFRVFSVISPKTIRRLRLIED